MKDLNNLIKLAIDFLNMLIVKYETGEIDHETFCICSKLKVEFIESKINETDSPGLIHLGKLITQRVRNSYCAYQKS